MENTARESRSAAEVTALLDAALKSNPIIAGQSLSPMNLITLLPLPMPVSLRGEINMIRGLHLPQIIEDEFLSALLAKGSEGEVPRILRKFWGEDLRSHFPNNSSTGKSRGKNRELGRDITNSRLRFLRDIHPGLERMVYEDENGYSYINPVESYEPATISGELYPSKDTADLDPKVQLNIVRKRLGKLLPWGEVHLHSRFGAESLNAALKQYGEGDHSPEGMESVAEAVLATKLRYMNAYSQGEENAQGFMASMVLTLEMLSLDMLVEFHALVEEYNLEWALAAYQGFSPERSSLMGQLGEMINSVPGYSE